MVSRPVLTGVLLTAVGLAGYVLGVVREYPGRAFTVTVVMVAITLLVIGDDWGEHS